MQRLSIRNAAEQAFYGYEHGQPSEPTLARFRVNWVAHITGRGTAIAGDILDGTVSVGDWIVAPTDISEAPLKVSGVEFADNPSTKESWVALFVTDPPAGPATPTLKAVLDPGTIIEISSSRPTNAV